MARYDAFLLRIWRSGAEGEGGQTRWAIRLEHLPDGQGARLDSLEALLAHLVAVLPRPAAGPAATAADEPAGHTTHTDVGEAGGAADKSAVPLAQEP